MMEEKIRGISDFRLEISDLKKLLTQYKNKIQEIRYRIDPRLNIVENGTFFDLDTLLEGKMKRLPE